MFGEKTVIEWNIKNPLDRWWRSKHNVVFNSPQHRDSCPADILFEFIEDKLYNKTIELEIMNKKKLEEFEKGKWLKEQELSKVDEDKLFNKLVDNFKLTE